MSVKGGTLAEVFQSRSTQAQISELGQREGAEVTMNVFQTTLVALLLTLVVETFTAVALESEGEPGAPQRGASILDGKTFRSRQYNDDGTAREWDLLSFRDGKFISENCKPYGFTEAPYWLRFTGNDVHFLAETVSPDSGTMLWKGVVHGNKVEGNVRWTRERWYWTLRRSWDFKGTLQESGSNSIGTPSTRQN